MSELHRWIIPERSFLRFRPNAARNRLGLRFNFQILEFCAMLKQ